MKKLFGNLNLTYKTVIIFAIIVGVLVGGLNSIPVLYDTTITDIATYYDFWILCGILIIMNSKSNKDSALKCFLFFLISQPLIYLVEVPFNSMGWSLFRYYPFWGIMTILCLPMGYIGYYLKKDKWYGLLILTPMIILLTSSLVLTIHGVLYSFPHHLINLLLILGTAIIYPLAIFKNSKIKYIGLSISILCILILGFIALTSSPYYETILKCSNEDFYYDDTYKVYLEEEKYGKVEIDYKENLKTYCINAEFHTTGKTKLVIEDNEGKVNKYNLKIGKNTFDLDYINSINK